MTDPLLPAAILCGALALLFLVLWLSARGHAPRAASAERRLAEGADRAERDGAEIVRLSSEAARLREGAERLERQAEGLRQERREADARAEDQRRAIQATLDEAREEVAGLQVTNEGLRRQLAARAERHDEEVKLLTRMREDMTDRFKALAEQTLKDQGERFGTLNRERVEALMKPMREQVDHFQRELRTAHEGAAKDRERLKAEIEGLSRRSEEVSKEAVALTNALKGEKQRQGAWGEMILERVLEDSGLRRGAEFETQFSVDDGEGGRRRPDVVVRLPGDKVVVIDSKVSLVAYEAAVNAGDEEERTRRMRAHVQAVQRHIDELAGRDYSGMVRGAVDYVLMFMPVEGALAAALEVQDDLTSRAIAKRVGIATPTTLMMALRTIQHVWAVERRESNAEDIARRAGLLHDKMAGVLEAFEKVGDHLDRAQSEHSTALDRLSRGNGNVLNQFDTLRRLGARTRKDMPVGFDAEGDEAAVLPPSVAPHAAE
ncbi:DNA recombination protein RmuC [Hasllibacter halocynthiae]|uniref:DNA recombination protein RmuC homolog n=1 Tax=Hasllibacter halocynthiae TaxID=595589 RepID=A0A2T0X722_9RHOB|nr:DNA recombination protein RmuC [Hasllibacter halocynthiae]PRY94723.1 DNA recombination protein RmuC [Hasllibacter halocynthiae]